MSLHGFKQHLSRSKPAISIIKHVIWHADAIFDHNIHSNHVIISKLPRKLPVFDAVEMLSASTGSFPRRIPDSKAASTPTLRTMSLGRQDTRQCVQMIVFLPSQS